MGKNQRCCSKFRNDSGQNDRLCSNSPLEDTQPEENSFYDIWAEDTMSYPYSKYREGTNVEAHIRDFLTTWEINHAAQRLSTTAKHKLKIAELVLSLNGPSANWFAQNGIRVFESFEQLTMKFTQLFHREIPQKDLIG